MSYQRRGRRGRPGSDLRDPPSDPGGRWRRSGAAETLRRLLRTRPARALGITAATFLLGYFVAATWLFPASGDPTDTRLVPVPDVIGAETEEAVERLAEEGLESEIGSRLPHPRAPVGQVLAQHPLGGQVARPDDTVTLAVSAGPATRQVPELEGLAAVQAVELLRGMGFDVELRREEAGGRGGVLGSRPEPGARLTLPATVEVRVAEGAAIVEVPELRGRHVDDVETILEEAGLQLGALRYRPDASEAPGRVSSQSPPAGFSVRGGSFVSVVVAGNPPDEEADIARDEPTGEAPPDTTSDGPDGTGG